MEVPPVTVVLVNVVRLMEMIVCHIMVRVVQDIVIMLSCSDFIWKAEAMVIIHVMILLRIVHCVVVQVWIPIVIVRGFSKIMFVSMLKIMMSLCKLICRHFSRNIDLSGVMVRVMEHVMSFFEEVYMVVFIQVFCDHNVIFFLIQEFNCQGIVVGFL